MGFSGTSSVARRPWPDELAVRPCLDTDAEALWPLFNQRDFRRFAVMDHASFVSPDAVKLWLQENGPQASRLIGEIGKRIVAFAGLYPLAGRQSHVGWITLCVDENARHRGVGAACLQSLLATAMRLARLQRVQLHVLADNEPAISLYRSFGFRVEGRHEALVQSDGGYIDAYTMARLI